MPKFDSAAGSGASDRSSSPFEPCAVCGGDGRITAQRSGDWRRDPHSYNADTLVVCRICGGTGLTPRRGSFSEEC